MAGFAGKETRFELPSDDSVDRVAATFGFDAKLVVPGRLDVFTEGCVDALNDLSACGALLDERSFDDDCAAADIVDND